MPYLDYNLWSTWQQSYDLDAEPDLGPVFRLHVRLSYHRAVLYDTLFKDREARVPPALGWTPSQRILVLGCGFGWFVERMRNAGWTNLVGADTSTFVQTNKALTEEADVNAAIAAIGLSPLVGEGAAIKAKLFDGGTRARTTVLNEDGRTGPSRARIRQALGGGIDIVLTEDVVGNFTDAEAQAFSSVCHQIAPVVQHLVTIVDDPSAPFMPGNWKTSLEAWKAVLPADTFCDTTAYRVV